MPALIAIVDYGIGNQASVVNSLRRLGYRVKVSSSVEVLDDAQLLVLPGVGAFPAAMQALEMRGLVKYLQSSPKSGRPILGICLGMQLLASVSHEHGYTQGLGLIPGEFVPFPDDGWHIGWNTITCKNADSIVSRADGKSFYFNHSFQYKGSEKYQLAGAGEPRSCAAIIRNDGAVGVQFHPEKSQASGLQFFRDLIEEMICA